MKERFEELTFTDDFMFCKVLTTNPELCRELLELIIGKKVGQLVRLDKQESIEVTPDGKGVRFDVYSEDDTGTVYDCEMQTTDSSNLPKRARYYQGMIDLNLIERGADYNELKMSYIIFICPFDVFEKGLHKYTFENYCAELPDFKLADETSKIFLCAGGTADDVSEEIKSFLDWLSTGKRNNGRLVNRLEDAVQTVRSNEKWSVEYMTLYMKLKETYNDGVKAGITEGRTEGQSAYVVKFLENGWNIDKIAEFLKESPETIRALIPEGYSTEK